MPADCELLERVARAAFPDAEVELLGAGGFTCTFRVERNGEDRAVKVLDPDKAETVREVREVRALELVDDPNVVRYYGAGEVEVDGTTYRYLEMDYIEGQPLSAAIAAGEEWSLDRISQLARDLVAGASAIWAANLAHRDVTPKNIMIRPDGQAVIVDLGIARHLDLETVTHLPTPGTPGWMAPEQVGPDPEHGDWRSDQFVIGLVLYQLATGVAPYRADSLAERWLAPAEQALRPPTAVNPDLPDLLGDVIAKMTAPEPYQRYLSPEALTAAVEAAGAQIEAQTLEPGPGRGFSFALAQGHQKNFTEGSFYTDLAADAIIVDARCASVDKTRELLGEGGKAKSIKIVDPVNYFDRSPVNARPTGYQRLPYGGAPPISGFSDATARRAYLNAIVDYQLALDVDAVISPYFYSGAGEMTWLRESTGLAALTAELLEEKELELPVWTGCAIPAALLGPNHRAALLNLLTGARPSTLYLLVHTGQGTQQPLAEDQTLAGLQILIDTLNQAGTAVVVGRRFSEGLLLGALGASGWSVGAQGTHQNFQPNPEQEEDGGGGRGLDWYYVPQLLNSISIETRARLYANHTQLLAPSTGFAREIFATNLARAALGRDTAARVALIRHNLVSMRQQAADLAAVPANRRVALMRGWIDTAENQYNQLAGPWHPAENPSFLASWRKVL
jgi:hypothetical protein